MAKILVLILCAMLIWFGLTIIRLESYRYAAALGFCDKHLPDRIAADTCRQTQETRTNPLWHLAYGLRLL